MKNDESIPKKTISAKESSKWGQIVASIWIAGWCSYAFITGREIAVMNIVISGFSIASCFLPTFVSIITDKIKEMKAITQTKEP